MKILILGGTAEARQLANRLVAMGHDVTSSLAGRTSQPVLPEGRVRSGGFGGIPGLVAYLEAHHIERLIDATHPYAEQMSAHAVRAGAMAHVPLVRLLRPGWTEPEGADWLHVRTMAEAAGALPSGARVLVTSGHAELDTLLGRVDCGFVVRVIEPPAAALPSHAELLLDRPPYGAEGEAALLRRHAITHLVTKNSGGGQTSAKLMAAQALNVRVIMVARPDYLPAVEVTDIAAAIAALHLA
ncbi:MAG TPA: cobalt-precorrin-6A reductase [Devosiaceae bacterium]|jgi:precorrin-6A/cobalt-precorrin-6A reductase